MKGYVPQDSLLDGGKGGGEKRQGGEGQGSYSSIESFWRVEVTLLYTVSSQDNEEPPALPPRTLEGLQVEEEPIYEAEPEPEPENDYEDVEEMDRHEQEDEPEGDYEEVLEPEGSSFSSAPAGE